jgi:hypothetical protein
MPNHTLAGAETDVAAGMEAQVPAVSARRRR